MQNEKNVLRDFREKCLKLQERRNKRTLNNDINSSANAPIKYYRTTTILVRIFYALIIVKIEQM